MMAALGFDCAKELSIDAGAAEVAAIVSAKISVTLTSIVMLSVEAAFGLRTLDRTTQHLFPHSHSKGLAQCKLPCGSVRRVAHIGVDSLRNRSAILRLSSSTRPSTSITEL